MTGIRRSSATRPTGSPSAGGWRTATPSWPASSTAVSAGDGGGDARELEGLLAFREDAGVLDRLLAVKAANKDRLCRDLLARQGMEVDPMSVFDIQAKRLHEYKRQQMNALYVIHQYLEIKAGRLPERPVDGALRGQGGPRLCDGQAHHPPDFVPEPAGGGRPPRCAPGCGW